jgi:hypothetical protein
MANQRYDQKEADKLLDELVVDPAGFKAQGKTLGLLEQFFEGLPLIYLHNLFTVVDGDVLRVAIWIASELGHGVDEFLDEAITLHDHHDRWIRHHADNIIARATASRRQDEFFHVLDHLEDPDRSVMGDALRFFVNSTQSQLKGALARYENRSTTSASIHTNALHKALDVTTLGDIRTMVESENRLEILYGAGIAIRTAIVLPRAMEVLAFIRDADVLHAVDRLLRILHRTTNVHRT